jgi:hypothetical protein
MGQLQRCIAWAILDDKRMRSKPHPKSPDSDIMRATGKGGDDGPASLWTDQIAIRPAALAHP